MSGQWGGRGPQARAPLKPVPSPSFLFVIEHMMPLCMVISWVYSVAMTIQHIVAEKEHRLKEVRAWHLWAAPSGAGLDRVVPSCVLPQGA